MLRFPVGELTFTKDCSTCCVTKVDHAGPACPPAMLSSHDTDGLTLKRQVPN